MENPKHAISRRTFVAGAGGAMFTVGMSAKSYARILGANDRIRLGQLGCGSRSHGHVHMAQMASKQIPVETIALCDLWSLARDQRAAQIKSVFNLDPRQYKYSEEMLANKDIDGVMIATGDFQHAKLCTEVVKAGKDCYVEKPFANVLSEAIEARDTTKSSKQIVQVGTQHRSQPYPLAVRDVVRSGRIGDIVHIEQEWNVNEERWRFTRNDTGETREMLMDTNTEWKEWLYGRQSKLKEEDTDWKRWLLGKPYRPFDPHVYLEFRLYKDFSAGIFDQWLSHGADMVHLWTDETHPVSVVANGGIFTWKDDRENPDTCVTAIVYPKGFLYTYKTIFGNSYRSFARINGRKGTIENYGGEGASLFMVTSEGGVEDLDPEGIGPLYTDVPIVGPQKYGAEVIKVAGAPSPDSRGPGDDDLGHMLNWLQSMQTRTQPNATVDNGFSHALVCIMAAHSYWEGKKLYWDPAKEQIVDQPLPAKTGDKTGRSA
jgi:predicted dehydrogenase